MKTTTTPANFCNDEFRKEFAAEAHDEFFDHLTAIAADTRWEPVDAKGVTFVPLSTVEADHLALGGEEELDDSMKSPLPIVVSLEDGRKYLVRPYLLKSIKQHHRDNAQVLSDMLNRGNYEKFCEHLNLGAPFLKKKILMMTRGGKVTGWFSEFNGNWSQLDQYSFFEEKMKEAFPGFAFEKAETSHYFTSATYALDKSMSERFLHRTIGVEPSVMEKYLDAWVNAGFNAEDLARAVPTCRFITGESGLTSIEVYPAIRMPKGPDIPLGSSLKVNHRGEDKNVWGKFETFPPQVAVLYQKGLAGLGSLCKRRVFNPFCCTTQILSMFRASVPVDLLIACAEDAEIFWPRDDKESTCYAIEIFNNINEMVNRAAEKLTPVRRLRNTEMLGRLMHANWDEFDVPRMGKYCGKAEVIKAATADDDFGI